MNAKKEILRTCKKRDIEAINIEGELFKKERIPEALKKLNYEFDDDYGIEEGPAIYVWCKKCIIISVSYDGAEWYECVPRNPEAEEAERYGGG